MRCENNTARAFGGETKDLNTSGRRPADGLDDRASEPSAGNSVRGVAPLADPVEGEPNDGDADLSDLSAVNELIRAATHDDGEA
eukprot:COSAG02_NODE_2241_length_9405_cov_7.458951_5_plen_84_part_00